MGLPALDAETECEEGGQPLEGSRGPATSPVTQSSAPRPHACPQTQRQSALRSFVNRASAQRQETPQAAAFLGEQPGRECEEWTPQATPRPSQGATPNARAPGPPAVTTPASQGQTLPGALPFPLPGSIQPSREQCVWRKSVYLM